jgi:hypothetical protein
MSYWRDFYGQDYISMIERADTSIVWDFARCVSRSGIKHRFGAPAKLQFYWRPHLAMIIWTIVLTRFLSNWNTQIIQVALPFPFSLGVSSSTALIFLNLEHVFLWSPRDQLHSRHLVDGLEQSLPRCPSVPQLKHPVKCFASFPLEKASMCSSSSLSLQLSFNASMSIALESRAGWLVWKQDDDEPAMGKKPVLCGGNSWSPWFLRLFLLLQDRHGHWC